MGAVPVRLVGRYLSRRTLRSALTIASIAVAIFLLCALRSLIVALNIGVLQAGDRIIVQSAVSLFVSLPYAYESKIRAVDGVATSCQWIWFGGQYKEPENFFAQFAVQPREQLEIYPEIVLDEAEAEAFLRDQQACIVGYRLAERYGFEIGDSIPLEGTIYARHDGAPWTFTVAGIYRSTSASVDDNTMFFHIEYLKQTQEAGECAGGEGVNLYVVDPTTGSDPIAVMRRIDAVYENGPQRVQSTSEDEFQRQFVSMQGNIPLLLSTIGTAVFLSILLAVLNAMLMSAREQIHDVGILKALGFGDGAVFWVLLSQALLICAIGAAAGMVMAKGSSETIAAFLGTSYPGYEVTGETLLLAGGAALALALLAGVAPAWSASRARPVDSLRAEG